MGAGRKPKPTAMKELEGKNWKEHTSEAPKAFRSSGDTQFHMKQRYEIGTN